MAEALDSLNSRSSPGQDGMPSAVYNTFYSFFIPLMMGISHKSFTIGRLPSRLGTRPNQLHSESLGAGGVFQAASHSAPRCKGKMDHEHCIPPDRANFSTADALSAGWVC